MKKTTALLLTVAIIGTVFLNALNAQQFVGIGTTNPQYMLDVSGRMRVKTGTLNDISTSSGIWLEDFRNGSNRVFFGMRDSIRVGFYGEGAQSAGWGFAFNARTAGLETTGDFVFYKGSQTIGRIVGTDSTLQINSTYGNNFCFPRPCQAKNLILLPPGNGLTGEVTGRLGIGTNRPAERVDINGNTQVTGTVKINGDEGNALEINGAIKVTGNKPAFVLTCNASNLTDDYKPPINYFPNQTYYRAVIIDNAFSNKDPNAIILVTPLNRPLPFAVQYDNALGKWKIKIESAGVQETSCYALADPQTGCTVYKQAVMPFLPYSLAAGDQFNVLIIKQ